MRTMTNSTPTTIREILTELYQGKYLGKGGVDGALSEIDRIITESKPKTMEYDSSEMLSLGWIDEEYVAYNLSSKHFERNLRSRLG